MQIIKCDKWVSNLKLETDGSLIEFLIEKRFEGKISKLLDEWYVRFWDANDKNFKVPHHTSIRRWLKGEPPRSKNDVLRLSGLLDIDPVALFKLADGKIDSILQSLTRAILFGNLEKGTLSFVNTMFNPKPNWPPSEYATQYFDRKWVSKEFIHEPKGRPGFYATLELFEDAWDGVTPRVYHFAYHRKLNTLNAWIPYGVVVRSKGQIILMHSAAYAQTMASGPSSNPTRVGTWFGERSASFKIVSIHDFELNVKDHCDRKNTVHFLA